MAENQYPRTPDGRYFIVRGRLWRLSNPELDPAKREALVAQLMEARRAVRLHPAGSKELDAVRKIIDRAKTALGERGAVWWKDGAPDYNRKLIKNTPYAAWFLIAEKESR